MKEEDESKAVYFVGELVCPMPSMFFFRNLLLFKVFPENLDDYANLRPLKGAANMIAQFEDWPKLYDLDQLARNQVKVSAAT